MNNYIIILVIVILLVILYFYLLRQSKKPSGPLGKMMMKIWDKSYSSLYKEGLNYLNINREAKINIVDLGIGSGKSTEYLANYYYNSKVIGVDYAKDAIVVAKENNRELIDDNRVSIIQGSVENILLKENYYDLICAFQTHFHWSDFEKAVNNIYSLIKKDGFLLISCEKIKLKYYLKEYQNDGKFIALMKKIGFSDVEIIDNKNKMYIIKK